MEMKNSQGVKLTCGVRVFHCEEYKFMHDNTKNKLTNQTLTFSFNITTGTYPFEGDNIYRLLETIGKGIWSLPEGLDASLGDLLTRMLEFDVETRYTILQIRNHPWFITPPANTGDAVAVPPLANDFTRSSTVLPYLESYHYEDRQSQMFFTEHDLNGELMRCKIMRFSITFVSTFRRTRQILNVVISTSK